MKKFLPLLLITYSLLLIKPVFAQENETASSTQIRPLHYSFENSIGKLNEYLERGVLSGSRPNGTPIDTSDPNNYGAVALLMPRQLQNELKIEFAKTHPDYVVILANGDKKPAGQILAECSDQNNLQNCPDLIPMPMGDRCQDQEECSPEIKTTQDYFQNPLSPLVIALTNTIPFLKDLQNALCNFFGLVCGQSSLPLQNSQTASGWAQNKPNIANEAVGNAQILEPILVPKGLTANPTTPVTNSYFDMKHTETAKILGEAQQVSQMAGVGGGFLGIFQPRGLAPDPTSCQKDSLNPQDCPADFYFTLDNAPPEECPNQICHTDTPDQKSSTGTIAQDDRLSPTAEGISIMERSLTPRSLLDTSP